MLVSRSAFVTGRPFTPLRQVVSLCPKADESSSRLVPVSGLSPSCRWRGIDPWCPVWFWRSELAGQEQN